MSVAQPPAPPANRPAAHSPTRLGWWQARRVRQARLLDVVVLIALVALGATAIVSGRHARRTLAPETAVKFQKFLDELDAPTRLPNVPLLSASGRTAPTSDWIHKKRAVVAFYAPWCGPCQKELPEVSQVAGTAADLLIVVSKDEDVADVRRHLADLGLSDRGFFVDTTGQLYKEGPIIGLPTTMMITPQRAILTREVGYNQLTTYRLKKLVNAGGEP